MTEWDCAVRSTEDGGLILGRICAIRKTAEQAARSAEQIRRNVSKKSRKTSDVTYFVNEYVILFTTFEPDAYPLRAILSIYRWRWQIELLFKRFKSLLQFGHVLTRDDKALKAWLYGKLFVALLVERISRAENGNFSPGRRKSLKKRPFMNLWRRFAFVTHSLQRQVTPEMPLSEIVGQWERIDRLLAAAPRKRKYQLEEEWFEYLD